MHWVKHREQYFNLDNIAAIWIEVFNDKYFLMGEMMHNEEEVVLSGSYPNREQCEMEFHQMMCRFQG